MLAKEIKFIERFKARASHAAQVQSRVKKLEKIERVRAAATPPDRGVRIPARAALRRGRGQPEERAQALWQPAHLRGLRFQVRRQERWCVMGVNGAGKSTLLKLVAGATPPDDGTVALGGSVKMGYFAQHAMDLLDGDQTIFESLEDAFPQAGQGVAAHARRLLRLLRRRRREALPGAVGRREGAPGDGKDALRSAEFPGAGRAHEPSRHGDQGNADHGAVAVSKAPCCSSPTTAISSPRCPTGVLELTPDGIHQYGGGYTEYVARTGREAPGLRS